MKVNLECSNSIFLLNFNQEAYLIKKIKSNKKNKKNNVLHQLIIFHVSEVYFELDELTATLIAKGYM